VEYCSRTDGGEMSLREVDFSVVRGKEIGWHKYTQGVSYPGFGAAVVTGYTADERLLCDNAILLRDMIKGTPGNTQFIYCTMGQMVNFQEGGAELSGSTIFRFSVGTALRSWFLLNMTNAVLTFQSLPVSILTTRYNAQKLCMLITLHIRV